MKKINYLYLLLIGVTSILLITGCGMKEHIRHQTYKGLTVYSVKVTSSHTNVVSEIKIKGVTDAPNGAKVLAQSTLADKKSLNLADKYNHEYPGYVKVKNHKFTMFINEPYKLVPEYESEINSGEKLRLKIFAVTGYNEEAKDDLINADLRRAVKIAKIKPSICEVDDLYEDKEDEE